MTNIGKNSKFEIRDSKGNGEKRFSILELLVKEGAMIIEKNSSFVSTTCQERSLSLGIVWEGEV